MYLDIFLQLNNTTPALGRASSRP